MQKWIWWLLAFLVSAGVFLSLRYGMQPRPVRLMNPTQFEKPEQIGAVVYRRLLQPMREQSIIGLSVFPLVREYDRVLNGFLAAARADGWKPDLVVHQPGLRELRAGDVEQISWQVDQVPADPVRQVLARDGHVVVYGVAPDVSHWQPDSWLMRLESQVNMPVPVIHVLPMAVREEEIAHLQPPCPDKVKLTPLQRMGCAAADVSRRYLRKDLPEDQITAVLERHGRFEYLLFVYEP